jgi:hypothetical protein
MYEARDPTMVKYFKKAKAMPTQKDEMINITRVHQRTMHKLTSSPS